MCASPTAQLNFHFKKLKNFNKVWNISTFDVIIISFLGIFQDEYVFWYGKSDAVHKSECSRAAKIDEVKRSLSGEKKRRRKIAPPDDQNWN